MRRNTMNANTTNTLRKEVYRRDGYRCAICDATEGLQLHHIKPRGKGGRQAACITLAPWDTMARPTGRSSYHKKLVT